MISHSLATLPSKTVGAVFFHCALRASYGMRVLGLHDQLRGCGLDARNENSSTVTVRIVRFASGNFQRNLHNRGRAISWQLELETGKVGFERQTTRSLRLTMVY
jgi:hypothetical protein